MGLTGKYDFQGIRKQGGRALALLISTTAIGKTLMALPVVGDILRGGLEAMCNWLANNGLVILNLGAISVGGMFDQMAFDKAMDDAFKELEDPTKKLTPQRMKEIDDAVIKAARKFLRVTDSAPVPDDDDFSVPNVPNV